MTTGKYSLNADWLAEPPRLVRTFYRSTTPDGSLWCESRDPEEVKRMSEGHDCAFSKVEYYEITAGWEEWKP